MNAEAFLRAVEDRLADLMEPLRRVLPVPPAALGGGKRIRPRLIHACASEVGLAAEAAAPWAALVEAVHCASLLHDDVIDDARLRRGVPSLAAREGNRKAVLAGDLLVSSVWLAAVEELPQDVSAILARATVAMAEAEMREDDLRWNPEATPSLYLQIVDGKTAALFAAAAEGTAALAGSSDASRDGLSRAGLALGRAFQVEDDAHDYTRSPFESGKEFRKDLAQGLVTLPLILALGRSDCRAAMLRRHLRSRGRDGLDPRGLERLLNESQAVERCWRLARGLRRRGALAAPCPDESGGSRPAWLLSA